MAREAKSDSDSQSFDIEQLQKLMELMEKHDVREIKIQNGEEKYFLRRGSQEVFSAASFVPQAAPPVSMPSPPVSASSGPHVAGPAAATDEGLVEIKSPTVGTFYQSSSPGDPPFVKVGDQVHKETIVCIVEAMKVFNQIPADVSGTIQKLLIKDGDPVEYGQRLFLVKPD